MYYNLNNVNYEVIIEKKRIKNCYIRVKEDLKIYVSANYLISRKQIKIILDNNKEYLAKSIKKQSRKIDNNYYYLGKKITIEYDEEFTGIENGILYVKNFDSIEEWFKKRAKQLFEERIFYWHNKFEEDIPYPSIKCRNMKTRWGVCNKENNSVTLNLQLIHKEMKFIDYVIIHELSHFVHFDHSKCFWNIVSKYEPNYKLIRKQLKE